MEDFNLIDCIQIEHYKNNINNTVNSDDFLNIMYVNIRSVRNKFQTLKNTITSYNFIVHIIVLSETHLFTNEESLFQLNNYDAFFSSRDNNRGGGVVIYVLNTLTAIKSFGECFLENNFLVVELPVLKCNLMKFK